MTAAIRREADHNGHDTSWPTTQRPRNPNHGTSGYNETLQTWETWDAIIQAWVNTESSADIVPTTPGTAQASKAVVLDANSKIDTLDITAPKFNGVAVTASGAQLNAAAALVPTTAGTSEASKALTTDSQNKIDQILATVLKIGTLILGDGATDSTIITATASDKPTLGYGLTRVRSDLETKGVLLPACYPGAVVIAAASDSAAGDANAGFIVDSIGSDFIGMSTITQVTVPTAVTSTSNMAIFIGFSAHEWFCVITAN